MTKHGDAKIENVREILVARQSGGQVNFGLDSYLFVVDKGALFDANPSTGVVNIKFSDSIRGGANPTATPHFALDANVVVTALPSLGGSAGASGLGVGGGGGIPGAGGSLNGGVGPSGAGLGFNGGDAAAGLGLGGGAGVSPSNANTGLGLGAAGTNVNAGASGSGVGANVGGLTVNVPLRNIEGVQLQGEETPIEDSGN